MAVLVTFAILVVVHYQQVAGIPLEGFYPFGETTEDLFLPPTNDGFIAKSLVMPFPSFDEDYTTIYVSACAYECECTYLTEYVSYNYFRGLQLMAGRFYPCESTCREWSIQLRLVQNYRLHSSRFSRFTAGSGKESFMQHFLHCKMVQSVVTKAVACNCSQ